MVQESFFLLAVVPTAPSRWRVPRTMRYTGYAGGGYSLPLRLIPADQRAALLALVGSLFTHPP